ncbi:AAA family ATPase [Halovivax gelatinilyticus]|uniref:AAA family ATPase n=1 Tax=Halovivax gelatinilyticus TaxID=2961597 RepID=UPI0020CA8816|nr:AAA family ATPase [Halovivax gelatinilyticus]
MHLHELRIDDFGCFRGARLDSLGDSLVVIGGPQRAGKTTFVEALRQFPDGVGRGDGLPPATDTYRVDAELTRDGHRYRYVLNGHATPAVSPIDGGPGIDADDVFGPVSARQYRTLYTISLDELRRLPPGIDDAEDLARILLGGAYGDLAEIPDVEATFADRADEIGLSKGNPNTKSSKLYEPYRTIERGIDQRAAANEQVDDHRRVTAELEKTRSDLSEIDAEIERKRLARDRLTILEELFEQVNRVEALDAQLDAVDGDRIDAFPTELSGRLEHVEAEFETATRELTAAKRAFDREASIESTERYLAWLSENERRIESLREQLPVWRRTREQLITKREKIESTRDDLEREIATLHSEWGRSFGRVDAVETSAVETARVEALASRVETRRRARDELATEIRADRTRLADLESKLERLEDDREETSEVPVSTREPAIVAAVAIAAGTAVALVAPPVAGGVVALAVLAVGLAAIDSTVTVETTVDAEPYRELAGQVATIESDVAAARDRLDAVDEELAAADEDLETLVGDLGLPESLPPGEVADFYDRVVDLAAAIDDYRGERREWESETEEFGQDLERVASSIEAVTDVTWSETDPLAGAETLLSTLESVASDLELAREVRRAERERADRVSDIDAVLTAWDADRSIDAAAPDERVLRSIRAFADEADRVARLEALADEREQLTAGISARLETASASAAFDPIRDGDEPLTAVVREAVTAYADIGAIEAERRAQRARIDELRERRRSLQETQVDLERRRDALASEDDLREARATIDEGRVAFERLGEAYAVNRIAASMVGQLHDRLLADVVHSLVDDASEIFSEITREYEGIELDGDLRSLEFRALCEDGPDHGVGELSRATAEQLFLAVRLARIRRTDVQLPVVLDDAATNFDPHHMARVFRVIDELSATTQVFFLTCHPQCVKMAAKGESVQYWSLDDGRFTRRDTATDLERHLAAE